jgi:hypothetical protein
MEKYTVVLSLIILILLSFGQQLSAKSNVKAEQPYFHRYIDVKEILIGGIPEDGAQTYMSQIMTAGLVATSSKLGQQTDQNADPVNVEDVDCGEQMLNRYYDQNTGKYYYTFQVTLSSQFTGSFHGSPIDPLTLAAVVIVFKYLILVIASAVVIVIAVGLMTQWLKDITTRTYEKVTYDSSGNIIATERGTEPTVDATQWLIIICVTVALIILIPQFVTKGKKKKA